jgi:hypothetical protein
MKSVDMLTGPDPFAGIEVPPELEVSIQRHRANLVQFILSLQSAGVSEDQIEESVTVIVRSYKEELIRTLKTLVR